MWFRRGDKLDIGIVVFELTDACNQACKFCYNHLKGEGTCLVEAPNFRLARRTLKRLLSEARIGSLSLSGGEPMLLPRIHDLVLRARMAGSNVNILTNGTLLTDNDIAIFDDLGVGTLQIPMLSHNADIHDSITQLCGSWLRATTAARRVAERKEGWLTPVLILSRLNYDAIEPTMRMYAEMGCRYIMVNRFNIGGLGKVYHKELTLTHDELRNAFRRVDAMAAELKMTIHSGVCTPMCLLDPKEYPHIIFTNCSTDLSSRPLTVNYRGDVRFCNHSPRVLGNIYSESLRSIIERSASDGYFDSVPESCAGCKLWQRCRGGCRAASEQMYGTFDRIDPVMNTTNE
ncbi:MAG: radical SAM protein [Alistipes sp.]|nr:radical SAM protein [Alistipes sp.]